MGKVRTTIYLDEELHKKLKIIAIKENTSSSNIIEKLIEKYIKKEK